VSFFAHKFMLGERETLHGQSSVPGIHREPGCSDPERSRHGG